MDYTNALETQDPMHHLQVAPAGGGGGAANGVNGIVKQLLMMKMMQRRPHPQQGLMGQPVSPDPVMGTGFPSRPSNQASSLSYLNPAGR